MKKVLLSVFVVASLLAESGVYQGTVCTKKSYIEDVAMFSADEDTDSIMSYIETGKCLYLSNNVRVSSIQRNVFGNAVGFTVNGSKLFGVVGNLK